MPERVCCSSTNPLKSPPVKKSEKRSLSHQGRKEGPEGRGVKTYEQP